MLPGLPVVPGSGFRSIGLGAGVFRCRNQNDSPQNRLVAVVLLATWPSPALVVASGGQNGHTPCLAALYPGSEGGSAMAPAVRWQQRIAIHAPCSDLSWMSRVITPLFRMVQT